MYSKRQSKIEGYFVKVMKLKILNSNVKCSDGQKIIDLRVFLNKYLPLL